MEETGEDKQPDHLPSYGLGPERIGDSRSFPGRLGNDGETKDDMCDCVRTVCHVKRFSSYVLRDRGGRKTIQGRA